MKRMRALVACVMAMWAACAAVGGVRAGDPAPELVVKAWVQSDGKWEEPLKANRGKVVVLDFWATWCGPCVGSIPEMNALIEEMKGDEDVVFIAISDEKPEVVEKFLRKREMRAHVAVDDGGATMRRYDIHGYPTFMIVAPDGRVYTTKPGRLEAEWLRKVARGELKPDAERGAREEERASAAVASVSVRRWESGTSGSIGHSDHAINASGMVALSILRTMYGVGDARVIGRELLGDEKWVVDARAPEGEREGVREMTAAALGAALGVEIRKERREVECLVARVVNAEAEGMKRSDGSGERATYEHPEEKTTRATGISAQMLLASLERILGVPVEDETGLEGLWDWDLALSGLSREEQLGRVEERLGIRLASQRREIDVVVVRKRK